MDFGVGRKRVKEGAVGCSRRLEGGGGGDARAVIFWRFLWGLILWYRGVDRVPGLWFLPGEVLEPRYEGWVSICSVQCGYRGEGFLGIECCFCACQKPPHLMDIAKKESGNMLGLRWRI